MRLGTKSLLFGVHHFLWHPITVLRAWVDLYGRPNMKELICIFIHDWGYWGCSEMDGRTGSQHPIRGAKIAGWLFGQEYYDLCVLHSRTLSDALGMPPSKLCWADKLSMAYDPRWFYLLRASATGEIKEYRENSRSLFGLWNTNEDWFDWLQEKLVMLVLHEINKEEHV